MEPYAMNKQRIAKKLLVLRGGRPREAVAKDVGISVSALQMYEGANRIPRDEIKRSLAQYYGTTVAWLFFDENVHAS